MAVIGCSHKRNEDSRRRARKSILVPEAAKIDAARGSSTGDLDAGGADRLDTRKRPRRRRALF
jgi:hypothetical protein